MRPAVIGRNLANIVGSATRAGVDEAAGCPAMHRAWLVAAAGFVALLAAAAIRATFGILMEPLMMEFGWGHGAISTAASINLVVFGLSAPFAAAFTDRFGLRRVVVAA